ncbi:MAG: autotransporter-associated beta strand repeat-containing protein [Verrucomicrobiota bacterium]|nr:autotransporter-associated beta strand repeat-containing protein [Verrucomicrobiota bacterium]
MNARSSRLALLAPGAWTLRLLAVGMGALAGLATPGVAQTAAWTGAAGNNRWHDPLNWNLDTLGGPALPGPGTNVVISAGAVVLYDQPFPGDLVGPIRLSGQLSVASPGLWVDGNGVTGLTLESGGLLQVSAAGALVITNAGTLSMSTDSILLLQGGSVFVTNHTASAPVWNAGVNGNNNGVGLTNLGGRFITELPLRLRGRFSRFVQRGGTVELRGASGIYEGSNDQERPWLIDGGTAWLGDFSISRATPTGGLILSNGAVTTSSLRVGTHNSRAYATIYGGTLTNTGVFTIGDRTNGATSGDRRIRFLVRGGTVVSTHPDGIVIANQSNQGAAGDSVIGAALEITGGQLFAEKVTLIRDGSLENAHATLALSNNGTLWLGSGGLLAHVGSANTSYRIWFAGGTLGALADFSIQANVILAGENFTIHTADPAGNPHEVSIVGSLTGNGSLVKTGRGTLSLQGPALYSGRTFLREGRVQLRHSDALLNTPMVELAAETVLDVTLLPGLTWAGPRSLTGLGTVQGPLSVQSGGILAPGFTGQPGALTIQGSLTLGEGAVCQMDLPANPTAAHAERLEVQGDLTLAGQVTFSLSGGGPPGSVHPLIRFTGNLTGDPAHIRLSGLTGIISNNTSSAKGLYLVITQALRAPTSLAWIGSPQNNIWDNLGRTNWLNLSLQQLDQFVPGDSVRFDDRGAAHRTVQLVEPVYPSAVWVDTTQSYRFVGTGNIAGTTSLVKANRGTLVIENTNTYSGPTRIADGVLETPFLANGGVPSGLGAAAADPTNLRFSGGTLRYTGLSLTHDRGATLEEPGGVLEVALESTTLSWSGPLVGPGGLTKTGPGTLALLSPNSYQGPTSIRQGTVRLAVPGSAGTNRIELAGGTLWLTLPSDNELPNPLSVTAPSRLLSGTLNNRVNGPVSGSNTLHLSIPSGTVLTLNGDLTNFTGTFALGDSAGIFRFNSGGGNTTLGCPNATIHLGSNTATLQARNAGTMFVGSLRGGPNTQVLGQGAGSGTLTWTIGSNPHEPSSTFEGVIADAAGGRLAALTKVGPGTLRLTGTSTYTGPTRIESGILQVDGSLGVTTVTVVGGTLAGTGLLHGPVEVQNGGTLAPGPGIATLTVANHLSLAAGSRIEVEVNAASGLSDQIVGLWSVTYGGTLRIIKLQGNFAPGQRFKLFDAPGTYTGAFEAVEPTTPAPGLAWDTSQLAVDGTLGVIQVEDQALIEWLRLPNGLQLSWRGPYRLQVQTNSLNVGLGTNWVDYPGNPPSGILVPLDPRAPTVFFRLLGP